MSKSPKKQPPSSLPNLEKLESDLNRIGQQCAKFLIKNQIRLVLVESCTGGLVHSTLTQTPGVSSVLTGSFVTYQVDSKTKWLGVPKTLFRSAPDGVSPEIAGSLAWNALQKTPHADLAISITGRLGPSADPSEIDSDGYAWLGLALQGEEKNMTRATAISFLPGMRPSKSEKGQRELRRARQILAARGVIEIILGLVQSLEREEE